MSERTYPGTVYGLSFDWNYAEPMPILTVLAKTDFDSAQPIDVTRFLSDCRFDLVIAVTHKYGAFFFDGAGFPYNYELDPRDKTR